MKQDSPLSIYSMYNYEKMRCEYIFEGPDGRVDFAFIGTKIAETHKYESSTVEIKYKGRTIEKEMVIYPGFAGQKDAGESLYKQLIEHVMSVINAETKEREMLCQRQ